MTRSPRIRATRGGFTLVELMFAVAVSSAVAAIGFVGIQSFGKAILRAKQFTAETQLITAALTYTIRDADGLTAVSATAFSDLPVGWPKATANPSALSTPSGAVKGLELVFDVDDKRVDFVGRTGGGPVDHRVTFAAVPRR